MNQSQEDYLEAIYVLSKEDEHVRMSDVAKHLSVSKPSVNKAINLLQETIHSISTRKNHRNGNYRTYTVKNNISILLEDIIYNLTKQIAVVLKYAPQHQNPDNDVREAEAERITFAFLDKIPKIREYIPEFFEGKRK